YDLTGQRQSQKADIQGVGTFVRGRSRILMLGGSNGNSTPLELASFDENTLAALGRWSFSPTYNPYPAQPIRMLAWGSDGVAFVANQELFFGHTELAAAAPVVSIASTVNAATIASGSVAPGEIISLFGTNLGTAAGRSIEFA